jgi:hypothetical protein
MPNSNHPPYFRNVSREDWDFLRETRSHIWEQVKEKLYTEKLRVGEKKLEEYKPGFIYNPRSQILAISIGRKKAGKRRILRGTDVYLMNDLETRIFFATRSVLGESLEGIRLGEEKWEEEE